MRSIRPIPPMPMEFRMIILFYLIFLSILIFFQAKVGADQAVPAFTMPGNLNNHERSLYRWRDWHTEMDRRLNAYFKKQPVEIGETTWLLREKSGKKPLCWSTTIFHIEWDGKRRLKELLAFQKSLEEQVTDLGGDRLFADVCKNNGVTYYRFDYGVHWGSASLVTHRIYITKPERYPDDIGKSGFAVNLRPRKTTPKPQLDMIRLTPKQQLIPVSEDRHRTKADVNVKEATVGLKRIDPLPATVLTPQKPRIAIIIDDFGYVKEPAEAYFRIHAPLTIAVLPGGEFSKEYALRGEGAGFEVLLHQPLEPLNMNRNNPGPGFINGRDTEERIREEFEANLAQVPGAVGFNNHMGSAGTQDKRLMSILMSEAKHERLFFIDSRSIANTVGEEEARKAGVLHAGRRVFLDNDLVGLRKQLETLKMIALHDGEAIGIAHARPGVAQVIEDYLSEFERAGIKIVHVSELVHP